MSGVVTAVPCYQALVSVPAVEAGSGGGFGGTPPKQHSIDVIILKSKQYCSRSKAAIKQNEC